MNKYLLTKTFLKFKLVGVILLLFSCSEKSNDPILDFLNLRFGIFVHYNMGTYHGEQWAKPNHDPKSFAPSNLNCDQWATAAKSAKMNYAVFTTKHHDGFCLWDTKVTDYDVASSAYSGDIVEEYVDAFRKQDIKVGLYFSVWDRQHKIEHKNITPENIQFTKDQLSELLTNYGEIICIVIDGWGSKWGHGPDFEELPFAVLANHIHSIQPNCLVINHSCKTDLDVTQLVHYEATHGQHCPDDNTIPSQQGPTIQSTWFWESGYENQELKSIQSIIKELNFSNSHYANYLLNAAPNDKGLMDENVITRLKEVGNLVVFPKPLTVLPTITPVNNGVTVTASSSRNEEYTAKNVIDCNLFTRWQYAKDDEARWLELDFGLPKTFNRVIGGEYKSGVDKYRIEAFVDDKWKLLAKGEKMTHNFNHSFDEITAQKYRLTIVEAHALPKVAELTFVKY